MECVALLLDLASFICLCRISSKSMEMLELLDDRLSCAFLLLALLASLAGSKFKGTDSGSLSLLLLESSPLKSEKLLDG